MRNARNARSFEAEPAPALQPGRQIAAQHAARIRRQKRHPGKQSDLGDVHPALLGQIERDPEGEGLPRGFGQKARDGNGPETRFAAMARKLVVPVGTGRWPSRISASSSAVT
jgi:hypothetical protein